MDNYSEAVNAARKQSPNRYLTDADINRQSKMLAEVQAKRLAQNLREGEVADPEDDATVARFSIEDAINDQFGAVEELEREVDYLQNKLNPVLDGMQEAMGASSGNVTVMPNDPIPASSVKQQIRSATCRMRRISENLRLLRGAVDL
jgi:hypothetical protein